MGKPRGVHRHAPPPRRRPLPQGAERDRDPGSIGAGVTSAFRQAGYAVVATARTIRGSGDPELATIQGDIAEAATAEHVVRLALERFGRIDTLVNTTQSVRCAAEQATTINRGESRDLDRLLSDLLRNPPAGVYVREPAGEVALERMQAAAMRDLCQRVPDHCERLLRATNGIQISGTYFKSAEDVVLENLDYAMPGVIVLGNRGNVDQLVYDQRDQRFATINMGFPDERYAAFESFADLLVDVMKVEEVL
jgi:hypothetical protein